MKMTKLTLWLIIFVAVTLCIVIGFLIVPDDPALRSLGFFLYFYTCIELAIQIGISHKKKKEEKLREREETGK